MPQSYTPSDPTFSETINVYKNGDPASGNEMALPLKALQDNVVAHRKKDVVASEAGSHGLRYYQDKLERYDADDEEWKEIDTGGGVEHFVSIPSVSGATSFTYDGTEKGITLDDLESDYVTITDQTATNAGSYTCTVSLTDTQKTVWTDLTIAPKTFSWSIAKASAECTLSKNSLTLDAEHLTDTVTISDASGTASVTSSDTTVATASLSDDTITIASPDGKSGTATITVSIAASANYNAGTFSIAVEGDFTHVYGVQWDGSSTSAFSRTDAASLFTDPVPQMKLGSGWTTGSSPFDTLSPWKDMVKETRTGGVMVKIPKYYYKWTRSGASMKLQIADGPMDGFFVSPAHADRGDGEGERDFVYVGRYHCSSSDWKSTTGATPKVNITRDAARTGIHGLGSTIWQYDYAMFWTINMLYLVEFGDWNSQAKIGYGCAPDGSTSAVRAVGYTDAMTYHTGTDQTSKTTYGGTQYRWIEGLWDNCYDWCDGIYFSGSDVYCIKKPASFSDTTGGTKVGVRATTSNCIKAWTDPSAVTGFEYALYPNDVVNDSTYSTYVCDHCSYYASGVVLFVGGYYGQVQDHGAFCLDGDHAASASNAHVGSRLQELPSAA